MRSLLLLIALVMPGCLLEEVDLTGKACPCAPGFECDLTTRTCFESGVDLGVVDLGPPDLGERIACIDDRACNPPDEVCVSGFCRPGCGAEGEACTAPATCDATTGHCLVDGVCSSNADCAPPLSVCVAGRCEAGCTVSTAPCRMDRVCNAASGLCEIAPTCADDQGCPNGYWCDGLGCRQRCTEPGAPPCRGDSTCNTETGRCDGASDLGESCAADRNCISGDCLGVVIGGNTSQVCSRTCAATSDCRLGTSCLPVSSAGQCLPASLLNGMSTLATRSGGACETTDNQCQSTICEASACAERCYRARDCVTFDGTTCVAVPQEIGLGRRLILARCIEPFVGGAEGDACVSNQDCANGVCDPGSSTCAHLCCGDADCTDQENCVPIAIEQSVLRVCQTSSTAGSRPFGGSCTSNAECASGVCGPADAANPNGARICTTYCCNDPDCDLLPGNGRCVTSPGPIGDNFSGRCVNR